MHIQPRLYAGELLDLVATHIQVSYLMEFIAFSNREERNCENYIYITQDSLQSYIVDQSCTTCCENRHISVIFVEYLERPCELVIIRGQDVSLPCYFFSYLHISNKY